MLPDVTDPTVMFGVPERPVAVPVKVPTKLDAVTIPVTTAFVLTCNLLVVVIPVTFRLSKLVDALMIDVMV
jgi:hypothetical protein